MRYADPFAQAEIDRLRAKVEDMERLDARLSHRLLSSRKAGDQLAGEVEALERKVDAVAALHRRAEPSAWAVRTDYCQEDGDVWPCITARAIGVER